MKRFLLLFLLSCSLSYNSFSQKVNYNDLVGTKWISNDTTISMTMEYDFEDSSKLMLIVAAPLLNMSEKNNLVYSLDTLYSITMLHYEGVSTENIKINSYSLIKMPDKSTLKLQGELNGSKPTKWDDNESFKNTLVLIRLKGN